MKYLLPVYEIYYGREDDYRSIGRSLFGRIIFISGLQDIKVLNVPRRGDQEIFLRYFILKSTTFAEKSVIKFTSVSIYALRVELSLGVFNALWNQSRENFNY